LDELVKELQQREKIEGGILQYDGGEWYKIKTEWYFSQSKTSHMLPNSERDLWNLILSGEIDDLLPGLAEGPVRVKIQEFCEELFREMARVADELAAKAAVLREQGKNSSAAVWAGAVKDGKYGPSSTIILFKLMELEEEQATLPLVVKTLSKACSPASKFTNMRKEFGLENVNYF
jgi:hypothetical protein